MISYRTLLQDEYDRRLIKNPRYSLRAFAVFLEMHPSALSRILSNKQDLSSASGVTVAQKLLSSQEDQRLFLRSIVREKTLRDIEEMGQLTGLPMLHKDLFSTQHARLIEGNEGSFDAEIELSIRPKTLPLARQLLIEALENFRDELDSGDTSGSYSVHVKLKSNP